MPEVEKDLRQPSPKLIVFIASCCASEHTLGQARHLPSEMVSQPVGSDTREGADVLCCSRDVRSPYRNVQFRNGDLLRLCLALSESGQGDRAWAPARSDTVGWLARRTMVPPYD